MSVPYSRRSFLAVGVVAALGGCVGGNDNSEDEDDDSTNNKTPPNADTDTGTDTPTEEPTQTPVTGVPEGISLMNPLPGLVEATDRAEYASTHDIKYNDGLVQVEIELTDGGERPDQYLSEVTEEYADVVVAQVAVEDLVALTQDENVHLVRTTSDPEPAD